MGPPWYLLLLVALVGARECPDGSICDNEGATRALPMITDVACTTQMGCPEEYSCVGTPRGGSACCPLDQGTPCQDGRHCCPSGTHCSEDGHSCLPGTASNQSAIICPDGASECPSGTTCCQLADQRWGCCPLEQATCCNDHSHCCPHNTQCDLEHGTCVSGNAVVPMSKKLPARMKLQTSATVQCDDTSACPGTTTCCRLPSGEWGCCPYEKAVCCSDHVHCCPNGYTCTGGSCEQGQDSIPWLKKIPALKGKSNDIPCDPTTSCPDESTCCRLPSGEWGCCPIEKAVCCSDHLHCCPSGYTCDVTTASCNKPVDETAAPEPASPVAPVNYVWCDGTHACSDGQTCCTGPGGLWTCCPYPQGVCCPDRVHCCPYGHVCLNSGAACSRSGNPQWDLGWLKGKQPTL